MTGSVEVFGKEAIHQCRSQEIALALRGGKPAKGVFPIHRTVLLE